MWFAGEEISFGDGYSLEAETLADTSAEVVKKLTASAPDHRHAIAIVRVDRHSQETSSTGMDRVQALLQESDQFAFFRDALPAVMAAVQSRATAAAAPHHAASPLYVDEPPFDLDLYLDIFAGIFGCFAAALTWIGAALGLILACGIPEPVEPLACAIAVIAFIAAGANVAEKCGS